jgi:uncharacterized protein (TIGR02186 family)
MKTIIRKWLNIEIVKWICLSVKPQAAHPAKNRPSGFYCVRRSFQLNPFPKGDRAKVDAGSASVKLMRPCISSSADVAGSGCGVRGLTRLYTISPFHYFIIFLFALVLFATNTEAKPVIADMSLRKIEIDSGFKGTEILLFGAREDAGDVVVVVRGPEISYIVRKKERIAGVWVNKEQAIFNNTNGFYAVATSRPLAELKNDYLLASLGVGMENLKLNAVADSGVHIKEFEDALLDKQQRDKLYYPTIGEVSFIGDTLFRTIIKFPSNIQKGTYTAEVYLFRDGILQGVQSTPLMVKKIGFDAFIFNFSYKYPFIYGMFAVLTALAAGWVAGTLFRKV